jgi:hypothetical protein
MFSSHANCFALIISLGPIGKTESIEPKGFAGLENIYLSPNSLFQSEKKSLMK